MRIQERCFLLVLCLLGGVVLSLTTANVETRITTPSGINNKDTLGVQPYTEWQNDTTELRVYPTKEANIKTTTEAKKKSVMDLKIKGDQKYQKSIVKDDDSKRIVDSDALMTSSISSMTASTKVDQSSTTVKSVMNATNVVIPFLLHGVPKTIAGVTKTTPMNRFVHQDITNNTMEATASLKGRALNVTASEPTNSLHANITDLSDISMDEDDKEVEGGEYIAPRNGTAINITSTLFPKTSCIYRNRTYSVGEKIVEDCERKCICTESGITDCQPLCVSPYVRTSKEFKDPLCHEELITEEPCCARIVCPDSAIEPDETCVLGNKTVTRGQNIEDGCSRMCICEAGGHLKCHPRCPPNETISIANQHDRCVALPDPRDPCCTITLCDVTLGDYEVKPENSTDLSVHLMDVKVLNSTAIKLKLSAKNPQDVTIEISQNNHIWRQQKSDKDGIIANLEPAHTYYFRVAEGSRTGPAIQVFLPAEVIKTNISEKTSDKNTCNYRGKSYKISAEWYDECIFFCTCTEDGKTECATIECPTDFGLDLLDPHCLDWETVPANFVPKAPQCCPQEVRCRNNGSCYYEGVMYDNWSELPSNVTGCERRCYCEMGNISCQAACKVVPALPPTNLPCPSNQATLTQVPTNPCCMQWTCSYSSLSGMNVTSAYPGPLATHTFDQQTIDNIKRPNNKSEMLKPNQESEHSTSSFSENPKIDKIQTDTITHGFPHYPMDPGHPTVPYNGPYSPDFLSTHLNIEDTFHLPVHSDKQTSNSKEKSKSKSDSKKPVELISGQSSNNGMQSTYFGLPSAAPKKTTKPHIFTQKNENGQIAYHIHTPDIPNTPQQIEELLAHINEHDPNLGPFQHYPEQPVIPHNILNGPLPTLPSHIDAHIPHSGLTHLNHPLAAQTPNQSGLDNIVPPGFSLSGGIGGFPATSSSNEVTMQILEALDEHTIRLVFTVPQVLVGLHGRVELRYTSDKTNFDLSTWKVQVFAPPNDLIATPQLEFELGDLKPMTEYKVKITVKLKDLANSPTSKIYNVRTLEKRAEMTTLPPQIPIDAELRIAETNSTWINVMWKKFNENELQFIDGVQLRYKEYDSKVYAATPLIHRAVTNYVIENLKPSTTYEVGIYFIPFPGQLTELISEKTIQIATFVEPDPYSFDVKVEIRTIKSTDVEVSWSGVPYPEDKYVNIYRAIYQSDTGTEDTSTFKIAKRDSHARTIINDLKPGTRYRLWLEIYLTNGRIKKSNVQDFVTKPGVLLSATVSQQAGKFASLPLHEGNYYGPLVIVAIVASLAILSTLILLMMLMKKRTSSKADISPRKTTSAYDNPSYKVELQQETMDL